MSFVVLNFKFSLNLVGEAFQAGCLAGDEMQWEFCLSVVGPRLSLMDYLQWKQLSERSRQDGWVQTPSLVITLPPFCSEYLENQEPDRLLTPSATLHPPTSPARSCLIMIKGMWLSNSPPWAHTLSYLGVGLMMQVYARVLKGVCLFVWKCVTHWGTIMQLNTNIQIWVWVTRGNGHAAHKSQWQEPMSDKSRNLIRIYHLLL